MKTADLISVPQTDRSQSESNTSNGIVCLIQFLIRLGGLTDVVGCDEASIELCVRVEIQLIKHTCMSQTSSPFVQSPGSGRCHQCPGDLCDYCR